MGDTDTTCFGKVGKIVNEDVVLQQLYSKCMPSLIYGLEAFPLVKSDLSSLDFVINRFFMKLLKIIIWMLSEYANSISTSRCQSLDRAFRFNRKQVFKC